MNGADIVTARGLCRRVAGALVALFLVAGCGPGGLRDAHAPSGSGDGHDAESGVSFNPTKGLRVAPETAKFIGLQVAEVEEREVAAALEFPALVYAGAGGADTGASMAGGDPAALASGTVSPAEAAHVREGAAVSAREDVGGAVLPGRVIGLDRSLENATAQIEVLVAISDGGKTLAPGRSVTVSVPLGGVAPVVSVPRSALLRTAEGDFVYTVSGDRFVRASVRLGLVNHEIAEVTDGLYTGDRVAVAPVMSLWMAELQSLRGGKSCAHGH